MDRYRLGGMMLAVVLLASVRPAAKAIVWLTGGVCETYWTEGCDERTEAEQVKGQG